MVDESGADMDEVAAVRESVRERGVEAGARTVTEGLIDVFAVAGTVDEVIEGLGPFAEAGMDIPLLWHTLGPDQPKATEVLARDVRPAVVT